MFGLPGSPARPAIASGSPTATERSERDLDRALRRAYVGIRNHVGHELALKFAGRGLPLREAARLMGLYQAGVSRDASYTLRDAMATLRSAYRFVGREREAVTS